MSEGWLARYRNRLAGWLLARGESAVAPIGAAFALILIGSIGGLGYWLDHTYRQAAQAEQAERLDAHASVLSEALETLLAEGQLTLARRLVVRTAERHGLAECRVVVGEGQILAAHEADQINVDLGSAGWSESASSGEPAQRLETNWIEATYPLHVRGHGSARLELGLPVGHGAGLGWTGQAGVGAAGVGALVAFLLLYRHARNRLRTLGYIQEALGALAHGEQSEAALQVDQRLGAEAEAWNNLLQQRREQTHAQTPAHEQAPLNQTGSAGETDLARGCHAIPQGVMTVDSHGRVSFANRAMSRFLNIEHAELVGQNVRELTLEPVLIETLTRTAAGELRRHSTHEIERAAEDGDDSHGVIRARVHPIREEADAAAIMLVEDITQQRLAEASRHQFVAQATHELRAPLTNIRLYLENAEEEGQGDPKAQSQALSVINQEAFRLERMVDEMLSVAQIESGTIQLRHDDVRLDQMMQDIVEAYKAQAQEKGLELNSELPPKLPTLLGDRDRLMLAIQNLLSNAIKYTPSGGTVGVSVEADEQQVAIAVRDTGMGISEEDQKRIFDKFYRARDQRVGEIPGTGLGLGLAKEIARLHGGDIQIESAIDQGSTFTLTLPASTPPAATG